MVKPSLVKTCSKCKTEKSLDQFYKSKRSPDGYQYACKACANIENRMSMAKKPEKYSNIRKRVGKQLIDRYHNWKRSLGCCFCGENEPICLELHHKDPSTKDIQPNKLRTLSWERIQKESVKCIMVCSNYHKKIHAGLLDDSDKPLITFSS